MRTVETKEGITEMCHSSTTDRVEQPAKTVTLVKQVKHDTKRKHLAEEHASVAATGVMRTLHQPHHVPEHIDTNYMVSHSLSLTGQVFFTYMLASFT